MKTIYRNDPEPPRDTVWTWPEEPDRWIWWDAEMGKWTANGYHGWRWDELYLEEFPMIQVTPTEESK